MIRNFFYFTDVRLYIDPATTSYIIQIIAGIVIAIGAGAGIFWSKLKRAVFKKKNGSSDSDMKMTELSETGSKDVIKAEDLLGDEDDD